MFLRLNLPSGWSVLAWLDFRTENNTGLDLSV